MRTKTNNARQEGVGQSPISLASRAAHNLKTNANWRFSDARPVAAFDPKRTLDGRAAKWVQTPEHGLVHGTCACAARLAGMKDPYQGLSRDDRKIVALIATAIANGNLLPHNRHSPLAARRVFEALKDACLMQFEEGRLN